jgi:hypothetical protein
MANFYLKYTLVDLVKRYKRLIYHFISPFSKLDNHLPSSNPLQWLIDLFFYIIDLLFVPELFLFLNWIFKRSMRKLTPYEMKISESIYGNTINYAHIYVDSDSRFLTQKYHFAYVSFNIINYCKHMQDHTFIHEMMHIYQYQRFGSVYIYRALNAQSKLKNPYSYGGVDGLLKAYQEKKSLFDFNFEAQASIIEHYFIIKNRDEEEDSEVLIPLFEYFHRHLFVFSNLYVNS